MSCADAQELLALYLSRELDARSAADYERHLEACSSCARDLRTQTQFDDMLREAVTQEALNTSRIEEEVRSQVLTSASSRRWWLPLPARRLAAIAAMVVAILGIWIAYSTSHPQLTIYADAADDHDYEVVQHIPTEWASTPEQVHLLLAEYQVPDQVLQQVSPQGYRLERAKVCELLHRNYVHAVFSQGSNEISIFLRRASGENLTGPAVESVNGRALHADSALKLQVVGFQSNDYTVLMVGGLSREQALNLMRNCARRLSETPVALPVSRILVSGLRPRA